MRSRTNEAVSYAALYILGIGVAHSASLWASLIIVNLSPAARSGNIADDYSFFLTRDFPFYHALIQSLIFTGGYLLGGILMIWALQNRPHRKFFFSALTAATLLIIWLILDGVIIEPLLSKLGYNSLIELIKDTLIPAGFYLVAWYIAGQQTKITS